MSSDRVCIKCGGSWNGQAFNTLCAHDFGEAPEPDGVIEHQPLDSGSWREFGFVAFGPAPGGNRLRGPWLEETHPTREGAIAAWKAAWCDRRDLERVPFPKTLPVEGFFETQAGFVAEMETRLARLKARLPIGSVLENHGPDPRGGGDLVTVQLFAPGAVMTEAERGKVIAAGVAKARREFDRPMAPCAGCGTVHEPQEVCPARVAGSFLVGNHVRVIGGGHWGGRAGVVRQARLYCALAYRVVFDADDAAWFGAHELERVEESKP
jgi:hypothetical protein